MADYCDIRLHLSKSTTLQKIKELCGTNATKFQEFFNSIVERQNPDGTVIFKGGFKNWYINTYNEEPNANPSDGRSARAIANRIAKYINKIRPSVVATARSSATAAVIVNYGYSSMSARNFAKRFTANVMLDFYRQDEYNLKRTKPEVYEEIQTDKAKLIARSRISTLNDSEKQIALEEINNVKNVKEVKTILSKHNLDAKINLSNANKQFYFNEVRKRIKKLVVDRIIETDPSLQEQVKSGDKESRKAARKAAIEKLKNKDHAITALGGKNIAYQNANLLALYYEVLTNPLAFLDEVSLDSRLGDFRYNSVDEFNDFDDVMAVDAQSELDDSNYEELDTNENPTDSDTDVTIMMYDHSGMFTSALMHVGFNIRSYFNSLKKLNSSNTIGNQPDYDLNNDLGVPDTMDANLCCTVMYHYGNYANVDAMIESVTTIANTIPGMTAFHTFAEDLKQNRDFAYEVYSVFGKTVIGKVETVFDGTTVSTKLRNKYSNRVEAFSQELLNSITHTSINNDFEEEQENLKELEKQLGNNIILNKILEDKNSPYRKKYVQKIYEALHKYYPTINEYSIENYINSNKQGDGNVDVRKNISTLVGILRDTINASKETQQEWRRIQDEGRKAYGYNKNLDKQEKEAKEAGERIIPKERKNVQEIYAQSHLTTKQKEQAILLSKELAPYSLISVEINSVNVEGKQSSDVINNSFLTYMKHVLEDDATLQNFGDYKFQSSQYNYSTILLEERDENGVITKLGLFQKQIDGSVRPTPYAKSLLQINMFDGGRNSETGENVLYSKMPEVDYIGTAFANFFNTSDYVEKTPVCEYFMRIPSDAPRNFTIRAPKLSAEGLFKIENETEIESLIRDRFKLIPTIKETNSSVNFSTVNNKSFITVNDENTYIEHLTAEPNTIHLRLPRQYADKFKDGQRVQLKLRYINAEGDNNLDQYILDGVVSDGKLINANLVGIKDANNISKTIEDKLRKKFRKQLEADGQIRRTINKEHPIFKQFKNIFKQELLDAGVALDFLFNLYDDGLVNREKDIYKPNTSKIGNETVGAFENYHYKGKNIIEVDEATGRERLTGNVFHSDRFVIYDENNEAPRNLGEEILEEAFDVLYGGATNKYLHVVRDASGKVVDVTLTPEQEEIIDNKLTEFINEYVTRDLKRLENVENALHGAELNFDTAAEFSLNYHLAYVGFGELFEGDTKFYKSPQDFLKRAKEAQGSGTPYGVTDYTHILVDKTGQPEKQDILDAPLSKREFAGGYKITQRTGFTGVTVINTVQTNKEALGILEKHLITRCGLTEKEAHDLLYGEDGTRGYQGTKVNDAQSYITFDEWVRRVAARGQLEKYTPLINKVLSGEDLTVEDITEFIQVQKNFYYDQHYNSQSGVCAPRQIKNAEFVLVPQLIKGTELEYVEKLMKKHDIDQLNTAETSKAGKTNILEIFDGKTGRVKKDIIKEIDTDEKGKTSKLSKFSTKVKAAKETFSYNFLYTQQETPQHMNAENKAGIQIMKKIVDNIPDDHPLSKVKDTFFKLYQANIKGSFDDLMSELNIELDDDGNISTTTDAQGNTIISGINYEMLYEKFRNECARLGLDSNMLDYVTLDDNRMLQNSNNTIMPNYMSRVSQKLENIAQALFNSSITRQKLPGFHAAQITSVGFNKLSNTVSSVGYSDKLGYHENKNGENAEEQKGEYVDYIEIMLPASAFGFKRYDENGRLKTDEELLAELREAKLDEIIGYRIPTEGKQSVCKMKVVGFVSDAYGSTIVVPNDWVTQTGSDFDIDSVYGIQFDTYIDNEGKIQKAKYKNKGEFDIYDWYRYITKKTGKKPEEITDKKFKEAVKQAKAAAKSQKQDTIGTLLTVEREERQYLPNDVKKELNSIHKSIYDVEGLDQSGEAKHDKFINKFKQIQSFLEDYISEHLNNVDKNLLNYLNNIKSIVENAENDNKEAFNKELKDILDFLRLEQEVEYRKLAEENGLLSKDDYLREANANPERYNSRAARNNEMLQCMLTILKDDTSLLENLSRSNFEDIIDARDKILKSNKAVKASRDARTPFNFLDQAAFHNDAMSGARLKGASVARDSFCSVCNTAKPVVSSDYAISVEYPTSIISYETAVKRFGEGNVHKNNDGTITIDHNRFGWSGDNKNVVGKILTSYSSQTTAHILDAIKEGNIPNVNGLTFGVYKLFPDLGIDYETAVSFMMQPGVTRIVEAYEKNRSIYIEGKNDPVKYALLGIAKELNLPLTVYNSIEDIIRGLDKALNSNFAKTLNNGVAAFSPLNAKKLQQNLNKTKRNYKQEVETILRYKALSDLAGHINETAAVCRPDKFGAKQSIFATEEVINTIGELLQKDGNRLKIRKSPILTVNGDSFLTSIYPGINYGIEEFVKSEDAKSAYPPLYSFLKYSTCPSILINRSLFITQRNEFKSIVKHLETYLGKLDEATYKDYEKYVITTLYNKCSCLLRPVTYKAGDNGTFVLPAEENEHEGDKNRIFTEEKRRILGYSGTSNLNFVVKDISNPTQEEVNAFAKLTPAEKVTWIQNNFSDAGVFSYLKPVLHNDTSRGRNIGKQIITFVDTTADIENIYVEFNQAFDNENPFVALAAYDLIKYAFIAEGYKMKRNGISKIIPNNVLYNDFGNTGIGLVTELQGYMNNLITSGINEDDIAINYIRTRRELKQIPNKNVAKIRKAFELSRRHGIIQVNIFSDTALKYNIGVEMKINNNPTIVPRELVYLTFDGVTTLYKIDSEDVQRNGMCYLYPLTYLEENEVGEFSTNDANNKYAYNLNENYYKTIIERYREEALNNSTEGTLDGFNDKTLDDVVNNTDKDNYLYKSQNDKLAARMPVDFDVEHPAPNEQGMVSHLLKDINAAFGNGKDTSIFVHWNPGLKNHIKKDGYTYRLTKTFVIENQDGADEVINLEIVRISNKDMYKKIMPYLEDYSLPIAKRDKLYADIITKLRENNIRTIPSGELYKIFPATVQVEETVNSDEAITETTTPVESNAEMDAGEVALEDDGIRRSTIEETTVGFTKGMSRRATVASDRFAVKAKQFLENKGISTIADVKNNTDDVIIATSEYVTNITEQILSDLECFEKDPDNPNVYLSVKSEKLMDIVTNDPVLRRRLLTCLLDVDAIVGNFGIINDLDIDSQDPALHSALQNIRDCINKLSTNTLVKEGKELFALKFVQSCSNNPLIQQDLINILDGFYSVNWITSQIGDLQETPNPLIQTISKTVTNNLFAKEKEALRAVQVYRNNLKKLRERARAAGKTLKFENIIDEDGRFIQNYVDALVEDMNRLRQAITDIERDPNLGKHTIEYHKAKLEYDKWKLENINQQLEDDYYRRKIELEEEMINNNPIAYVEYKRLLEERRNILSHITKNGVLDPYWDKERIRVNEEIAKLLDPYEWEDDVMARRKVDYDPVFNPLTGTAEEKRRKILYSNSSYVALTNFKEKMQELNSEYYDNSVQFGFEEELAKKLHIVESYERPDADGNPTVPANLLMEYPEYVEAKTWIKNNTYYKLVPETEEDANLIEKIREAFEILRSYTQGVTSGNIQTSAVRINATRCDAYDNLGVIDGRKIDDAGLDAIRKAQQRQYDYSQNGANTDKTLLKNSSTNPVVYTPAFYNGMRGNGTENQEWYDTITEINNILAKYYDKKANRIDFDLITDPKVLSDLGKLYDKLQEIHKHSNNTNGRAVAKFIEENVSFELTPEEQEAFDLAETSARAKGDAYYNAWLAANYLIDVNTLQRIPNTYIWGSVHPKPEVEEQFIDKEKTEALRTLNQYITTTPTQYYWLKWKEMLEQGEDVFNDWFEKNHVYNPYTHSYDPLRCWTTTGYTKEVKQKGTYEPTFNHTDSKPKADKINQNHKEGIGLAPNYKVGGRYDNPEINKANEFELELKEELQRIINSLIKTDSGRKFISKGYLPARHKQPEQNAKYYGQEFLKTIGWIAGEEGEQSLKEDITYAKDTTADMPMLALLEQKQLKEMKIVKPEQKEDETDEEFNKRMEEYEQKVKELKEANRQAHRDAIDKDWENVIADFIIKASHFNAVQENKLLLFYGRSMLDTMGVYKRRYDFFGDFKEDSLSTEDAKSYVKRRDDNLIKQYENWVRRIVYNQWKESNKQFTKWASRLQSLTSAQYMMLNIRGGIANVTVGEANVLAEVWAKEYFGFKHWTAGMGKVLSNMVSYFAHIDDEYSSSVADATIKWFNVVDYDEQTGRCTINESPSAKVFKRIRAFGYSPQSMGEFFMQNGALFSMLKSHRLYVEVDEQTGKKTISFKSEAEVRRAAEEEACESILTEEQKAKFNEMKKAIKADPNKLKEYAWRKRDLVFDFIKQYVKDDKAKEEFIKRRKELIKKRLEEHENDEAHPTIDSQLTLSKDQQLGFVEGSLLAEFDVPKDNGEPSDAYQLLADMRGRVISVNKKIHGVYDRLGQAQIEKHWWGSLVMQYHKHIYPGLLKRWRKEGYFNEQRGTWERGSYNSLMSFLGIEFRKYKDELNMTDETVNAYTGIQNILKGIVNTVLHAKFNWELLPSEERANIRRNLGDFMAILAALFTAVAFKALGDDDDEDGIIYNLALYEADRLASESFQFNPLGIMQEYKKLWSTPIAAQSGLEDIVQSASLLAKMLLEGEDFDPYYHTGQYAGEHKLSVYIQRRIPIWRGIKTGFIDIVDSNKYYKMGDNMLTIVPVDNIAKWVKGK